MAELRQTTWVAPVSNSQVEAVQKQIDLLQNRESTNEGIALAEHIQDAYASGDRSRLAPLIVRWREIESRIDPEAMADVLPQVRSVADWFDQEVQAERDAEAQSLALQKVHSIQHDAEAEEIRSVMEGIVSTGAQVPEELRASYTSRVREEAKAKRRRAGLTTGLIAVGLLALTSLAAVVYRGYQQEAALKEMVGTIESKLAGGDLSGAAILLESVPRDDERFYDFRETLSEKKLAEDVRSAKFVSDGEELRSKLKEVATVDQFNRLKILVSQFADRAKKDAEFASAKDLTDAVSEGRDRRKTEVIDEAEKLVREVSRRVEES